MTSAQKSADCEIAAGAFFFGERTVADHPDAMAPVFVTANYKLSFDHLRRALRGLDAWLLVLDTDRKSVV